jgi:putative ABC transport system permease protein
MFTRSVIVLIIMAASISLIYNAFQISVSERLRHLGLLSSAGATRRQKRYHVYFEGLIVGLIGIPTGILCGILGISCTFKVIESALISVSEWTVMMLPSIYPFAASRYSSTLGVISHTGMFPAYRSLPEFAIDAVGRPKR